MNIDGFLGIQFYDFEAYFAGDITSWFAEAIYYPNGGEPLEMFSGGLSKNYDSVNDVTIISGRSNMPPFGEDMEANIHCIGDDFGDIYLYA